MQGVSEELGSNYILLSTVFVFWLPHFGVFLKSMFLKRSVFQQEVTLWIHFNTNFSNHFQGILNFQLITLNCTKVASTIERWSAWNKCFVFTNMQAVMLTLVAILCGGENTSDLHLTYLSFFSLRKLEWVGGIWMCSALLLLHLLTEEMTYQNDRGTIGSSSNHSY